MKLNKTDAPGYTLTGAVRDNGVWFLIYTNAQGERIRVESDLLEAKRAMLDISRALSKYDRYFRT